MAINKKEMKQEYLENPCTAGVYLIQNRQTNRYLLGSAKNAVGAMNRHVFELRHQLHRNRVLQQDWDGLSEAQFAIKILESVKKDEQNISGALKDLLSKWQSAMDKKHEQY